MDARIKPALALSSEIALGQRKAVELMEATLDRIAATNSSVNAIVSLRDRQSLLAEAHAADQTDRKGWLHGIPIAIKDLANAGGFPTSMGSTLFAGEIAERDDIMVARLRRAGAIVIGKTNTPEFGLGSHTFNPVFGPTRNPYNLERSAGGSSGGAAVALASGMLSLADGSDMMGSLRNPAAWNNVYGMRPTWSLVPSEPKGDTFLHQLSTNGPMARNPQDLAALLDTMSGTDPRQPNGRIQPATLPHLSEEIPDLRLGWLGDWGGNLPFENGILDLCEAALSDMPVRRSSVSPPFASDRIWDSWITLRSFAVAASLGPLNGNPALKDTAQWEVTRGLSFSAAEIQRASLTRSEWFETAASLFDRYDVLAIPSAQVWPFDVEMNYPTHIGACEMDTYHRWMEVVVPASLIGLPAISVPVGFGGADDLPMGIQLIGQRGSDALLLKLAAAWHDKTNWPEARPPQL
ncbi:MAG: amidase [Paracoccaceae bacterium]